jgi:DNA-binding XRE family transcriptional regulator
MTDEADNEEPFRGVNTPPPFIVGGTDVHLHIARAVVVRRAKTRLTQEQLARLTGLTLRTVQRLEAGYSSTLTTALHVFHALGLSMDEVVRLGAFAEKPT